MKPKFIITIDVEGDNVWSRSSLVTTRNAEHLPRFHRLCGRFGFKPTLLTNYEMAMAPAFVRVAREWLREGSVEIGMHLHPWDSPPHWPLTEDDQRHHPYLIEYPLEAMQAKVEAMTRLLEQQFEVRPRSHRAGRWGFNAAYAKLLIQYGYDVDCSVTPYISWRNNLGAPKGRGGSDYRGFPDRPYFVDLRRIDRPGASSLLEVPLTVCQSKLNQYAPVVYRIRGLRGVAQRYQPRIRWLYPNGQNLESMRECVHTVLREGGPYLELVLHSSELMPGASPSFQNDASIDALYGDLESLFTEIARDFEGATLSEFRQAWSGVTDVSTRFSAQGGLPC